MPEEFRELKVPKQVSQENVPEAKPPANIEEILLQEDGGDFREKECVDIGKLGYWNDKGYAMETSDNSGRYSAVILGESHMNEEEWQKQMELVEIVKMAWGINLQSRN